MLHISSYCFWLLAKSLKILPFVSRKIWALPDFAENRKAMQYCPNCGKAFAPDDIFCQQCGEPRLSKEERQAAIPPPPPLQHPQDRQKKKTEKPKPKPQEEQNQAKGETKKALPLEAQAAPEAILNGPKRIVRRALWAALIFLSLIFFVIGGDYDMYDGGAAVVFVSFFLLLSSLAAYVILRRHYAPLYELVKGKSLLASWSISREQWQAYVQEQYQVDKAKALGLWFVVLFFVVLISAGLVLFTGFEEDALATAAFLFAFVLALGLFAWLSVVLAQRRRLGGGNSEVYLLKQGLYMQGEWHTWVQMGARLVDIRVAAQNKDFLYLCYETLQRVGYVKQEVLVPLPKEGLNIEALRRALFE